MKLYEVEKTDLTLIEAEKESVFISRLRFPFVRVDEINKNGRLYPEKVFTDAIKKLNPRLENVKVVGTSDHPLIGGSSQLSNVSHVLKKVWMENKVGWAEIGILGTTKGRDALKIIKSGVPIGASLRGFGEVDKEGKVKPGLDIKTIDLVVDPSFGADARIDQSSIIESYVPGEEEEIDEGELGEEELTEEELREIYNLFTASRVLGLKPFNSGGKEEVKSMLARARLKKMHEEMLENGEDIEKDFDRWLVLMARKGTGKQPVIDEELELRKSKIKEANIAGLSHSQYKNFLKEKEEKDSLIQPGDGARFMEAKVAGFKGSFFQWLEWRHK